MPGLRRWQPATVRTRRVTSPICCRTSPTLPCLPVGKKPCATARRATSHGSRRRTGSQKPNVCTNKRCSRCGLSDSINSAPIRHFDQARQAALHALEDLVRQQQVERTLLSSDIFARIRVALWFADALGGGTLRRAIWSACGAMQLPRNWMRRGLASSTCYIPPRCATRWIRFRMSMYGCSRAVRCPG